MAKGKSVSGNGSLNMVAKLDTATAKKNALDLLNVLKELKIASSDSGAPNTQGISNYRQAQLQMQESLRQSRLETERLKQEQQRLRNELQEGRISQQAARTALAQLALQQRQLAMQTRLAREAQVAASGSYREAQQRLNALGREIRETAGGFNNMGAAQRARITEYARLNAQLTEFDRRLRNNQRNVGNYRTALSGIGNTLTGLAAGYISAYGAIAGISKIVSNNAAISDSLADVRRTAGLTESEADRLLETFKKFDTRTDLKGLLSIAGIGGQIGIAKEELVGFTRSIDSLAVVLSNEIPGGADAVATSLGKINGVFKTQAQEGTTVEESFNRTGSAILKLGQTGLATGEFLVDFTQRVSGSAKAAGIALPTMLAYGSILEEAGKSAEVAGTSVNRLLSGLSNNRNEYFAIAKLADSNLTIKDFTRLINTDTAAALNLFFKGLNSGNPSQTAFNDRLKSIPRLAGEARNTIIALAQNQAELSVKVGQSTEAYEDAGIVADQIAIKNDTLAGSIDRINKVFENATTSGNIATFFKSIINFLGESLNEFNKLVNSKSWTEFFTRISRNDGNMLYDAKQAKVVIDNTYNKLFLGDQGKEANLEVKLKATGQKVFNKSLTDTKKLADDAAASLKKYQDYAGEKPNKNQKETLLDMSDEARKAKDSYDKLLTMQKKFGYDKVKQANAQAKSDETGIVDKKAEKDAAKAAKQADSELKKQRALQDEINALTKKGKDKQKTEDEQELAAVDDKYKKLRDKAIAYNKEQDIIDAERVKAGKKPLGMRVDTSGLALAQSTESDALRDKQSSEKLKVSLDKEQDLFAAYEDAKTKIGKDKAAERYKDQIDTDRTYLESLEMQREAILNPQKSKGGEEVDTEANQLQLKVLNEAIEKEKSVQQKKYDDLLASLQTFEQESKALTQQYEADKADLQKNGDTKALEERKKAFDKRLAELGDNHLQELDAFKLLYKGIDDLSDQSALKVVGAAEDKLKELKSKGVVFSKELEAELAKLFKNTRTAIAEKMPEKIISLANQIDGVANAVGGVDEQFGKLLSTLGSVVGQVGNIKKGLLDFKKASSEKDGLGTLTAGLGIVGSGVSILSAFAGFGKTIQGFFDKSEKREAQAAYERELQNKQSESLNKILERQIALLNDAYGTDRITKYNAAIKTAQDNQAKYQEQLKNRYLLTGNKIIDEGIANINNGGTGTIKGISLKDLDALKLPADLESLRKLLLDGNKLDAGTAAIVENLIKANESAIDLANNLKAENVGSSLDEIADSLISTLTDGTRDFGKSFEEIIRKSIINGFKQKLIEEQLQPFYNSFAELSKGGLTEDEIKTLQASYMGAADKAKQMAEDLKKATGIDITNPLKDKEGISGVITSAGLTEDTGNRAMGLWQGQYDQTKKIALSTGDIYRISVDNLTYVKQIAANTKRGADNTDGLGDKLDAIIANTDPDASGGTSLSQALRNSGIK
jgi:TP901 family phage tail tape measure protein